MARAARDDAKQGKKKASMKVMKAMKKGRPKGKAKAAGKTKDAKAKKVKKPRAKPGTIAYASHYKRRNWAKRLVWKGIKKKTQSGLHKRDLCVNRQGKVVSKRKSNLAAKRYYSSHLDLWIESLMEARKVHNVEGFVLCKKAGTKLERGLQSTARAFWDDAVAKRIHNTLSKNPRLIGKIATTASRSAAAAASSSASSSAAGAVEPVKAEAPALTCELRPGDRVTRRGSKGGARDVGVVERFQLGRVCVRMGDVFQSVKPEEVEKVG